MNNNDLKVLKALEASEVSTIKSMAKGVKDTFIIGDKTKKGYWDLGFTFLWCEKQNIKKYREMLGQDKRKLRPELKELYLAI